jgi:RHS repeat-associated protein
VFTLNSGSDGNALSSSTRFTYNSNGTIRTRKTYSGTSKEITSTYNYFSNSSLVKDVTQTNGVESRVTSYLYDNTERFISKITNPLGHTESFTIDLQGNTMVATDPNLKATNNTFNSWNQLIQSETPDASYSYKISWATTGSDIISGALYYTESQRNGLFNGAEYFDCLGRTLRKVTVGFNGAKFYTDTKYNIKGQVEEVTEPYLKGTAGTKKTGYTYLADGRVNTITLPDGRSITKAYPTIGAYHDELSTYSTGEQYYKKYNAAGLLLESSDPGGSIVYAYYKNGKLKSATAGGTTVGIRYDLYGRQQFLDDPDAGTIQYDYNAWDELTSQIQGDNNTIMTYDKLGRMLTKAINGIVTTYKYDPANAIGMIESITKGTTSGVYYKYDNLLNMTEEKCKEGSDIFTFNYEYDLSKNRLTKKIYPGGFAVSYEYNSYDDVTQIKNAADNSSIWTLNEVNSKGQLSKATYGNAKQITYGYDTKDRLNRIYVPGVIDFSYVFNDMNQLDWRDEKYYVNNQYQYFHERFTYDEVNRLSQVYHKLGTLAEVLKLSMDYSAPGNDRIVTKSDVGTFTYSDLTNHQVTGLSSSTGYLPTNHSYSYTSTGKISYIGDSQGNDLSIIYNVLNQRFIQFLDDGGDNLTRYYFNDYEKEIIAGQTRQLNYVYAGGNLVAIFTQEGSTTTPYYIYTDYLGSLRSITDGSGTVLQMLSFDAWGNRRDPLTGVNYTSTPQGLLFARGFTGHEHNDIMGLINMNGRFYDPALGLFISPDNFIQAPDFSQNFNRYAYAFNNPLLYTDPTGEWFGIDDAISAGVGFIVGYVTYGASTGNWGGKAVAAGGMGATVAWLGWNTMGAGLAALPAGGAGSATSFSAGMTAVFGSASGSYGLQFAALTALNVIPNSGDINKADEKGWNGVWAMGGFMTGSVLSTSLKPLSIGAKQGGLGLRQFAGVSLTNNLSDNMENGFFNFHSVHVGPVGWDAERHKNNHSDGWGGFYTIGSHGLTGDQQFAMGFETLLGLSLVKSDIYLPKYRRYMCGNGEWKFVNNAREAKIFGNKLVRTSQIGAWSRNILQGLDAYFMLTEQKTTYQHWYSLTHNDDGTLKGW